MAPSPQTDHHHDPASHRFAALADALSVAVLTADLDGSVDYVNHAARELFWRADTELLGAGWLSGVDAEDRDGVRAAIASLDRAGVVAEIEFRIDVGGIIRRVRGRLSAVDAVDAGDAGDDRVAAASRTTADGWVGLFDDVTSRRAETVDLAFRADHDALTGLPNRALLHDRVEQAMARSARTLEPMAVLFLDLDRFKPVNDHHGHAMGDHVLREIANRLRHEVRSSDTVARLGGDEFVVVTEGIDRDIAAQVAQRLITAIEATVEIDGQTCKVSASVGVAWGIRPAVPAVDLIRSADHAMYEAKRTGGAISFAIELTSTVTGEDPVEPPS